MTRQRQHQHQHQHQHQLTSVYYRPSRLRRELKKALEMVAQGTRVFILRKDGSFMEIIQATGPAATAATEVTDISNLPQYNSDQSTDANLPPGEESPADLVPDDSKFSEVDESPGDDAPADDAPADDAPADDAPADDAPARPLEGHPDEHESSQDPNDYCKHKFMKGYCSKGCV